MKRFLSFLVALTIALGAAPHARERVAPSSRFDKLSKAPWTSPLAAEQMLNAQAIAIMSQPSYRQTPQGILQGSRVKLSGGGQILSGASAPNGTAGGTATVGSIYMCTGCAPDEKVWIKTVGSGSTGWVALSTVGGVPGDFAGKLGDDYYSSYFGVVCNNTGNETSALNDLLYLAGYTTSSAGHGAARVLLPQGICPINSLELGPVAHPWGVGPDDPLDRPNLVISLTNGDSTHFEIVSGGTLDAGHVGFSFQFAVPVVKSSIAFDGTAHVQDGPAGGDNHWFKYFLAKVTVVTDPTHGEMQLLALQHGSLDVRQFPDVPHAANCINLPSGVPGDGCTVSYWCHEYGHESATCGTQANTLAIDAILDYTALGTYQAGHGGLGHISPYSLPLDTAQTFVHMAGSGQATTLLKWIGSTAAAPGQPAVVVSKNKYMTIEGIGVYNGTNAAGSLAGALAGAGAGNVDNGTHSYRFAYKTYGDTSRWGNASSTVTVADKTVNGKVSLTSIDVGPTGTTARLVYRSKAGYADLGPWYLLTTIADNSTTTYTDNTADASLGAEMSPKGSALGWYFGGLPGGGGTQTLFSTLKDISAADFHIGMLFGDNLGGETSEMDCYDCAVGGNDIGIMIGLGSYNTLDIFFYKLGMGFNTIGFFNSDGNVWIRGGSNSFNGVDYVGAGFGPMGIADVRSEGPGRFFFGSDPHLSIQGVNVTNTLTTRPLTGDVIFEPADTRTEASVVVSYPHTGAGAPYFDISFPGGAFTDADLRHTVILPGLGTAGVDIVGRIEEVLSGTTGTFYVSGPKFPISGGTVTATVYNTDDVDITFDTDVLNKNDEGSSIKVTGGAVTGVWNSNNAEIFIKTVTSDTTATGQFLVSNNYNGPLKTGATTHNAPLLWDNIAIELDAPSYKTSISDSSFSGRIRANPCGTGSLSIRNSQLMSFGGFPVQFLTQHEELWTDAAITGSFPATAPSIQTRQNNAPDDKPYRSFSQGWYNGHAVKMTRASSSNYCSARASDYTVSFTGNTATDAYAGNQLTLDDLYSGRYFGGVLQALSWSPKTQRASGNSQYGGYNSSVALGDDPRPSTRLTSVKELSEQINNGTRASAGQNLRVTCLFPTSDTCTFTFQRNEAFEYRSNGTGGSGTSADLTLYQIITTSGDFTTADLGKQIAFPNSTGPNLTTTLYGYIVSIIDATHIGVRLASGSFLHGGFPNGTTAGTAVVGRDEPNGDYTVAGIACSAAEAVGVSSISSSGFTLTSTNGSSTARCTALIVR